MSETNSESGERRKPWSFLSKLKSEFHFIKGNFLLLIITWLIMDFAMEIPSTYYALYVRALGGTAATIGLIGFASMIAHALVQFPGGYLADKHGRKQLISTMTFGMALSYAFYAFARSWEVIMLGAVIHSLCLIYSPALYAIIMDSLPPEKRGMGFSIINLITSVSTTPAPLVAAWLYSRFGLVPAMRVGYALVLLASLTAALLRLRLEETIENPKPIDLKELLRSYPQSILESFKVWKFVPNSAFVLFIVNSITSFSNSIMAPVVLLYVIEDLGISPIDWSRMLTFLFISMIFLSIPVGKMVDKVGRRVCILLSQILWALAILLLIYGNLFRLYIGMPLIGVLNILMMSSVSALFADLVPQTQRGKISGFQNFFGGIIVAFGQLLGGVIYEKISHKTPFLLQFVFVVPAILLMLLFVKEPKVREN